MSQEQHTIREGVALYLGPNAKPIRTQLAMQGVKVTRMELVQLRTIEAASAGANRLVALGALTYGEAGKVRVRLFKRALRVLGVKPGRVRLFDHNKERPVTK